MAKTKQGVRGTVILSDPLIPPNVWRIFSSLKGQSVCEKKSPRGERLKEEAIMNGWLKENAQKPSEMTEKDVMDNQKPSNVMENESKTVTETEKPSFPN